LRRGLPPPTMGRAAVKTSAWQASAARNKTAKSCIDAKLVRAPRGHRGRSTAPLHEKISRLQKGFWDPSRMHATGNRPVATDRGAAPCPGAGWRDAIGKGAVLHCGWPPARWPRLVLPGRRVLSGITPKTMRIFRGGGCSVPWPSSTGLGSRVEGGRGAGEKTSRLRLGFNVWDHRTRGQAKKTFHRGGSRSGMVFVKRRHPIDSRAALRRDFSGSSRLRVRELGSHASRRFCNAKTVWGRARQEGLRGGRLRAPARSKASQVDWSSCFSFRRPGGVGEKSIRYAGKILHPTLRQEGTSVP